MADRYASLKQGLVGCWIPSVSGSGLLLPDLSGRGNNGSLVGMDASDWVSGQYGRALDFNGVNNYVETLIESVFDFERTDAFSLSLWARLATLTPTAQIALSKLNPTAPIQGWEFRFFNDLAGNSNAVNFLLGSNVSGGNFLMCTGAAGHLTTGTWFHVGVSYRGNSVASGVRLFLSGAAITATIDRDSLSASVLNNVPVRLAQRANSANVFPVNGMLDDIRIYNRALTESEIRLLASEPGIGFKPAKKLSRFSQRFTYKPAKPRNYSVIRVKETDYATLRQGLVGAWCPSLPNGGSGNTLADVSGYNNHGVLTNMSPDDWVSGQYGRALDFDGSNDWVNLGDVLGFAGSNQTISISWWAYLKTANDAMIPFNKCRNSSTNSGWEVASYASGGVYYVYWFSANGVFPNRTFVQAIASGTALQWRHYAITFQAALGASAGIKIYENSALLTNQVGEFGSTAIAANSLTAKISARDSTASPGTPVDFTPAVLDDIRVYNRAISESEIRLLASRPGIGLRQESHRNTFYQFPSGARRKRILTGMP